MDKVYAHIETVYALCSGIMFQLFVVPKILDELVYFLDRLDVRYTFPRMH